MAGLGRRTFSPGEVLTASNVMNYLQDQVVQTYADDGARGSAIGTAVSEGMVSYLADSNMIESYTGTSWERQSGGLVPISPPSVTSTGGTVTVSTSGVVSFSGVTVLSFDNLFTTAYSGYRVIIEANSASLSGILLRYISSAGVEISTNTYFYGGLIFRTTGATAAASNNGVNYIEITKTPSSTTNLGYTILELSNPFSTTRSAKAIYQSYGEDPSSGLALNGSGICTTAGGARGFNLLGSLGIAFSGSVQIFGYKK